MIEKFRGSRKNKSLYIDDEKAPDDLRVKLVDLRSDKFLKKKKKGGSFLWSNAVFLNS
jgi:hypothetical protein